MAIRASKIVSYLLKVAYFDLLNLHLSLSWGEPIQMSSRSLATETGVPWLSCGFVSMILRLAI